MRASIAEARVEKGSKHGEIYHGRGQDIVMLERADHVLPVEQRRALVVLLLVARAVLRERGAMAAGPALLVLREEAQHELVREVRLLLLEVRELHVREAEQHRVLEELRVKHCETR